ncbi:hypothetical protein SDC9_80582 [bioreactor metagenome]|uniref:Uncharacterized protein n=1 Tax=bioreactor metagenome TaxID=1076179 RepID=A0A644Z1W0_9ZZZZ
MRTKRKLRIEIGLIKTISEFIFVNILIYPYLFPVTEQLTARQEIT